MKVRLFSCDIVTQDRVETITVAVDNTLHFGLNHESLDDVIATLKAHKGNTPFQLMSVTDAGIGIMSLQTAISMGARLRTGNGK